MSETRGVVAEPGVFKRYADFVARLRVPCGFLLVVTFGWLSQPGVSSLTWGIPVSIAGLALRAWATGHLEKNTRLTASGPYAFVRNPLYLGTALVAAGFVIASQRWILALVFGAVFSLVYLPVIQLEEQHLSSLFPEFRAYAKRVPALFPTLKPVDDRKRFSWALYRRNREYEALVGFMGGLIFLVGKLVVGQR